METFVRIAAVCVIGAVLAAFLKSESKEMGLLLALTVCAVTLLATAGPLGEVIELFGQMAVWSGLDLQLFAPLLKIVGVSLVSRLGTELCRDAGENAMAALVETGAAVGSILLAAPLFRAVWELLRSLI